MQSTSRQRTSKYNTKPETAIHRTTTTTTTATIAAACARVKYKLCTSWVWWCLEQRMHCAIGHVTVVWCKCGICSIVGDEMHKGTWKNNAGAFFCRFFVLSAHTYSIGNEMKFVLWERNSAMEFFVRAPHKYIQLNYSNSILCFVCCVCVCTGNACVRVFCVDRRALWHCCQWQYVSRAFRLLFLFHMLIRCVDSDTESLIIPDISTLIKLTPRRGFPKIYFFFDSFSITLCHVWLMWIFSRCSALMCSNTFSMERRRNHWHLKSWWMNSYAYYGTQFLIDFYFTNEQKKIYMLRIAQSTSKLHQFR